MVERDHGKVEKKREIKKKWILDAFFSLDDLNHKNININLMVQLNPKTCNSVMVERDHGKGEKKREIKKKWILDVFFFLR